MDATNAVNSSENKATTRRQTRLTRVVNDASIVAAPSYDEPYRFGRRPNCRAPFPFTEREFARLLIVRGRIHAQESALDAVRGLNA
jgi:hypothetical protein